ncbi:SAM-dependent methyltransferase [Roseixanthobacter liquoris]|uniref:SAM-dependent methyltransferase n=1 Tax=Roseixanthobacter liquoris TaxID=3119921 RepID=UPI00372B207A
MSGLEQWEGRYSTNEYIFGTEPNAFLKAQAARLRPGETALAIADGEGRNGVWLAQQGLNVTSVDFSATAIEKARRLAQARGVRINFECTDISVREWSQDAFDVAAAIFFQFAGPSLREQIFAGLRQTVKPGGLLFLQGYRPEQLTYKTGGPAQIENLYTRDMLERSFGDWDILDLCEHDEVLGEGSRHVGMSALIDLVARKPR